MLSWSVVTFQDGYTKVKELDNAMAMIKWGADYILNCMAGNVLLHFSQVRGNSKFFR